jgi:HEAT repeat protein
MTTIRTRILAMGLGLGLMLPVAARASEGEVTFDESSLMAQQETQREAEAAYRAAREALNSRNFQHAIQQFSLLRDSYPASQYVGDTFYWQAFALYRLQELKEALRLIDIQLESFPDARTSREARELQLRLQSLLGQRGDARAAERALRQAERALLQSAETAAQAEARAQARAEARAMRSPRDRQQQACEDEDDVRSAAINALMQMDTERALPVLMKVLERRDECSAPLRKQAIFVLSQHGDADQVETIMLDVARNDPDPEVQASAVFWLSQVGSERAVDALADILATSDDPRIQEKAIFALSQHMSDRAAAILADYARDESKPDHLRAEAIFWMSQHSAYSDPQFLIDLYPQLDSPELKEKVFFALSQVHDEAALEWMLQRALDPNEDMELRQQALFWAGQGGIEISRLDGLYNTDLDREMKEQIIFALSQRHDEPGAIDQMIQIARTETDPELRKTAIFWLGQSGDERAIQFLLELVEP